MTLSPIEGGVDVCKGGVDVMCPQYYTCERIAGVVDMIVVIGLEVRLI